MAKVLTLIKRFHPTLLFVSVLVLGFSLRLAFIHIPGNYDQESYRIVADIMGQHGNIYVATSRYNYSPLWALALQMMSEVATYLGVKLEVVVRFVLSCVDCVNALLLGVIFQRRVTSYIYLLNPVAILLVGYHGQFETLAALPLLIGMLVFARNPHSVWLLWLLATLTFVIKHIFIFHVWLAIVIVAHTRRRALVMMSFSVLIWLTSFIPYLPAGFEGILQNVLLYRGTPGIYGIGGIFPPNIGLIIFLVAMATLPFWIPSQVTMPERITICGVLLLTFIPGIGIHYLIIPILFSAVSPGYLWYTAWCTLLLLTSPNNIHILNLPPIWNYAWIGAVGWAMYLFWLQVEYQRSIHATTKSVQQ